MTEPEPDLGSSSPLLAETNSPLPLGLLMANGRVLCSKHISPWPRVGLACPAPSWYGEMPALLGARGGQGGMQQVLLSPIPRGSCPVLAGAAEDPNLGTPPCGTTSPATWTRAAGNRATFTFMAPSQSFSSPETLGTPIQDSPGDAAPGAPRTHLSEGQQEQAGEGSCVCTTGRQDTALLRISMCPGGVRDCLLLEKKNPQRLKAGTWYVDNLNLFFFFFPPDSDLLPLPRRGRM